jgi:hypothetical protein
LTRPTTAVKPGSLRRGRGPSSILQSVSYLNVSICPIGADVKQFTFIGWLCDRVETQGKVEPWVVSALEYFMVYNYLYDGTLGTHTCEVCRGYDCKDSIWIYGRNARYNLPKMVLH